MWTKLLVAGAVVLAVSSAEARRFVGETAPTGGAPAPTVLTRARWTNMSAPPYIGATLRGRYKCTGDAAQCPSLRRGRLLATLQHPGDFYGTLTFRDGLCRVVGTFGTDAVTPLTATAMQLSLRCSADEFDETHSVTVTAPAP